MPHSPAPMGRAEVERLAAEAAGCDRLEPEIARRLARAVGDPEVRAVLCEAAFDQKQRGKGDVISFSRNVFIPLTNLCRDRCTYCTFAKLPDSPEAHTYSLDEVSEVVRGGVAMGCIEALFCLGDKPEVAHRTHRDWLARRGFASTAEYLVEGCRAAFEGGMLPHTNAGILSAPEMEALRPWNASLGLMLETTSPRLRERGMPHFHAPDKDPTVRLRMHDEAGELGIPFTSGILVGIGETPEERADTLLAIRDLDDRHGHIQETIVQPFHPKPGTPMRAASGLSDEEIVGTVALARLILGRAHNLQAPPNLAPEMLERLIGAGVNDWGGVSPVTVDFINPEAPWPTLGALRERTEATGARLLERLPVYPRDVIGRPDRFDPRVRAAVERLAGADGYARPPERRGALAGEAA